MESIQQTINGTSTLTSSTSNGTVTISRNGDLVSNVYVTSSTPGIQNGDNLIQQVDLEIGGQLIDRQTKEWMQIWEELSIPNGEKPYYRHMKHAYTPDHIWRRELLSNTAAHSSVGMVQIPLQFWFCRNPGNALPLIALQYHEVKLKFTWGINARVGGGSGAGRNLSTSVAGHAADCSAAVKVWVDYIYLDTDERRRFAQVSHEYLIEQIQESSHAGAASLKLNFNHPVKELLWTDTANTEYLNAKIVLNGHDRLAAQEKEYFQLRQTYDYHTAIPSINGPVTGTTHQGHHRDHWFVADISGADGTHEYDSDATTNLDIYKYYGWYPQVNDYIKLVVKDNGVVLAPVFTTITAVVPSGNDGWHWETPNNTITEREHNHFIITTADAWHGITHADADIVRVVLIEHRIARSIVNTITSKINCYSFALKPEEHQPSGTCNFSRIDNAQLVFNTAPTGTVKVFAVNYNVLRIMSGMGGLAYSN